MPLKAYNFNFNKEDKIMTKAKSNFTKKEFLICVNKAIEYIRLGDILQVVLSQRWKLKYNNKSFSFYSFEKKQILLHICSILILVTSK